MLSILYKWFLENIPDLGVHQMFQISMCITINKMLPGLVRHDRKSETC